MKNKNAVILNWVLWGLGLVCSITYGILMRVYSLAEWSLALASSFLIPVPFLIIAGIILLKRRHKLVVPKYPNEKFINFTIRRFPFVNFTIVALAIFNFAAQFLSDFRF